MVKTASAAKHGVVLAGGRGNRLGQDKPNTLLAGHPLYSYAANQMALASLHVSMAVKEDFELFTDQPASVVPVELVREPSEPIHPLLGVATALELIQQPLVVCACDMPFVGGALFAWIAAQPDELLVFEVDGHIQPLLGRYCPSALEFLQAAVAAGHPARSVAEIAGARVVGSAEVSHFGELSELLTDIDTAADLELAQQRIKRN
ncbi:MAG: NTP transferase domain-containing protein [Thermoleophilaceae bacterium]|nr:NTP transferase domain-containing protein [Thermoleophilaceae bacterium]